MIPGAEEGRGGGRQGTVSYLEINIIVKISIRILAMHGMERAESIPKYLMSRIET